ncbi:hypothetical protein OK074_5383 [Actinobacteria bacterium OK074]|nr:hypothetical protein OK074_5383 [Actinobacteria bacterium OK074]
MPPLYPYSAGVNEELRTITVRLPVDLHRWLTAEAKSARRSLNSEIVHRLEVGRGPVVADADGESP